ncbi:MAG: sodium:proton antiporter NhaD [Gammaproteobacteria bacterium]|nr:sodium:proton antiporter NhaD [Gammaproteobacteria bacterium]
MSGNRSAPGLARALLLFVGMTVAWTACAADSTPGAVTDLTGTWLGILAVAVFFAAYALIISEEAIHLRKSKPVMVAAGLIWVLVSVAYIQQGDTLSAGAAFKHDLLEFAELFLFLLAAMTYINTMEERGVFDILRDWLVVKGFSFRKIFWLTGLVAFCLSPIADNLTTALLMATVVMSVGGRDHRFIAIACINIVVAANAGGVFSPFGDITTLMVWQKDIITFSGFFVLVIPALANWLPVAAILNFSVPNVQPEPLEGRAKLKHGAWVVVVLFLITITMAVTGHNLLHLSPVAGMMTGLGFLKLFGYYLQRRDERLAYVAKTMLMRTALAINSKPTHASMPIRPTYDIYRNLQRVEWDSLMFFYGIIMCVGGLGAFGYLAVGSEVLYGGLGPTTANVLVGIVSAIVDNIPVMFAVLEMYPDMSQGQWLLVTLTAGVGGSLLSIGSAAGVAVMGQARGIYTFQAHFKWSWAIAIGYVTSIGTHMWLNASAFAA